MDFQSLTFEGDTPSSSYSVPVYQCGPEDGAPQIYLQAAMHADEHPGTMVLHHLLDMLEAAEAKGLLKARFTILPIVNPLGLAHLSFHTHRGRYHPVLGLNYNRAWPDFGKIVIADELFLAELGDDVLANKKAVRRAIIRWLDAQKPVTALEKHRDIIMRFAARADMVLDLHCDDIALNHIFIVPQNLPRYQGLADWMGSAATLMAEDSGGGSFDEVWSGLWITLQKELADYPWPEPILSATLEYRGQQDVCDSLNHQDARNLYHFFCEEGLIDEACQETRPSSPAPTDLNACEVLRVDKPGLIAYQVALGDVVKKGDVIAELISLDGPRAVRERTPLCAGTDGVVFSLNQMKYVWPSVSIAKIAGTQKLDSRGDYLLED